MSPAPLSWIRWSLLALTTGLVTDETGSRGGYRGHLRPRFQGTLHVTNKATSIGVLDFLEIDEAGRQDGFVLKAGRRDGFSLDVALEAADGIEFVLYPAEYDVTVHWRSGRSSGHRVAVLDGSVTHLEVTDEETPTLV